MCTEWNLKLASDNIDIEENTSDTNAIDLFELTGHVKYFDSQRNILLIKGEKADPGGSEDPGSAFSPLEPGDPR